MEETANRPRRQRPITSSQVLFLVTVLIGITCGFLGLQTFISGIPVEDQSSLGQAPVNLIYYTLQMFVLGSKPLEYAGTYNLPLYIAMFAAPGATVLALYEAARALFAGQLRRWRDRRRRGHAIVVGDTTAARELVAQFPRRQVRHVTRFSPESLDAAGVAGAAAVYACADDRENGVINVVIARAAATAERSRSHWWHWWRRVPERRAVYAHVSSPNVALGLRARWLGGLQLNAPDVDFFTVDELAARDALKPADFLVQEGVEPHIVVAGLSAFGRALLVEYGRLWPVRSGRPDNRVRVSVTGADKSEVDALVQQWAPVCDIFDFVIMEGELSSLVGDPADGPPHRTFICYDDENRALVAALTASQLWRSGPDSVVIRLNRLAADDVFQARNQVGLLDDVRGTLRFIGVTRQACKPQLIGQDLVERLAENIHLQYIAERIRGEQNKLWDSPAMRPWDTIEEDTRKANRDAARDVGNKLSMIHATVAPRVGASTQFEFTDVEVDMLAHHEHERWCQERRRNKWTLGPRDDVKRTHPSLVDWSTLTDLEKDKDREAIQGLVTVLGAVGLHIVRLRQP